MTVCIAAICEVGSSPSIVLCADTRLDSSWLGSSDGNLKMGKFGYGWVGMLSGADWNSANDVHARIKEIMLSKGPPTDKAQLRGILERACRGYIKSKLNTKAQVDILVCGFISGAPIIATVSLGDFDQAQIGFAPVYRAIGSGGTIAEVFLAIRDHTARSSISRTVYVVYEAKKYSEKASGVGPETIMIALFPPANGDSPLHVRYGEVSKSDLATLEDTRHERALRDIQDLSIDVGYLLN